MSKFTPGPWESSRFLEKSGGNGSYHISQAGEMYFHADVFGRIDNPEGLANAALIAQSPERDTLIKKMLQAAEEYTGGLFCVFCNADGDQNDTGDWVVCHQEDCPGVKMQMLLREIEGDDA